MTPEEFKQLDVGKSRITAKYCHEVTFLELQNSTIPILDSQGRLVGGPDRKSESLSSQWLSWQRDVKSAAGRAGFVPPNVMAYFQATKHLMKPPTEKDMNIQQTGKIDASLIHTVAAPRFTWSPSKLMSFETCPAKFAAESYYRTVPYQETPQTIWGTRVHKTAEDFMLDKPVTDLEAFETVKPYCLLLSKLPGERLVEYKIALDENWKPCEWDNGVGRMILDLGIRDGKLLRAYDYKTGKMKDDDIQMKIYAYALAIVYPEIEEFDFRYIWLKDKKTTGFKLNRRELLPVAQDVRARIRKMKEAWDHENFPMRKNGLCRNYCGNKSCPYSRD